jgi:hypothetical protein
MRYLKRLWRVLYGRRDVFLPHLPATDVHLVIFQEFPF